MRCLVSLGRRAATIAAVVAAAGGAAAATAAVLGATVSAPEPRLAVDVPEPLFDAGNAGALVPGRPVEACATIANTSDGAVRAAMYASALTGGLARHLRLTVTRGTRGAGGGRGCATFVADRRVFAPGEAPGVVFRGALADFPGRAAEAFVDPDPWPAGGAVAYRFALAVADDAAAAGLSARWDWRLAADALPAPERPAAPAIGRDDGPSPTGRDEGRSAPAGTAGPGAAASRCRTATVAGVARGRRERVLSVAVRLRAGVRAVLVVRVLGAAAQPRLVLTTGLRVRDGRTLVIPRWARVRYRVNGRAAATARVRPFRVRIAANRLRPGRNRVTVTVRPRRGRPRTARFVLRVTPAGADAAGWCVVGR